METLPIDAVQPGAVLAVAVTDARGGVLVGEGKVLTEEWIQRLKARGVTRVSIQPKVAATATPGAAGGGKAAKKLARLEAMFAKTDPADEVMQALAAAARDLLAEKAG